MAALVKQYGVDFDLTDKVEKELRAAGAGDELLLRIAQSKHSSEPLRRDTSPSPDVGSGAEPAGANQGLKLFGEWRYDEALPFLRQAAQSGFAAAQVDLAWMYERGLGGLAKDGVQAAYWYRKGPSRESHLD